MVLQLDLGVGFRRSVRDSERDVVGIRLGQARRLIAMARGVSLLLGLGAGLIMLVVPFLVVRQMNAFAHAVLPLMMLGITGAIVHGVGFVPRNRVLRTMFSPVVAWPLVMCGLGLLTR